MESLKRMTDKAERKEAPAGPVLTKAEREMRLIDRNRKELDKRDEMIALQNVDIESSFESSRLPEDKRSVEKQQIRACLLESLENRDVSNSTSELMKTRLMIELPINHSEKQSENIVTSV